MEYCSYNEILNKIYNIVKGNDRLLRLLFYKEDIDIDDYEKYPKLNSAQKRETAKKYIKKMSAIQAVNNEVGCYVTMRYSLIDFEQRRKRDSYSLYWKNIKFDLIVTCNESIELLQDGCRSLEVISELQSSLDESNVDGIGNCTICRIGELNTVEGCISKGMTIGFYDVNEAKLWN